MAASAKHNGWRLDPLNSRLDMYYQGVRMASLNASGLASAAGKGLTVTDTGLTVTAGGLTVTAGGAVVTAGDAAVTAGNVRLGAISAFATTEPTSAIVFKQGTAFSGAVTTSGGLMSNGTVLRKIIADGTVSNVET